MVFADNQEGGPAMSHYRYLSMEEREKLYLGRGEEAKLRVIAQELRRAVLTISRDLKRNKRVWHPSSPSQAQQDYGKGRKRCGRKRVLCNPQKREYIRRFHFIQEARQSPEKISNHLKLESSGVQIPSIERSKPEYLTRISGRPAGLRSRCLPWQMNYQHVTGLDVTSPVSDPPSAPLAYA